ncbi:MAG: FAD-binding protein [Phycisphaerales bacterium]|nr:FAD-binding protein [Phycisphaerales bacterium]MCB9857283.1 FAD-binding protein [Phycisphaerales bacterium]MCB9863003.1 FAD-binding protein [Phycisphaerales bacterium]
MPIARPLNSDTVERFTRRLAPGFAGTFRTDRLIRAIYSTDASIYELAPDVVLFPTTADDVRRAVRACAELDIAITPRGAGTGLTGAAVNHGVQLDCSRHLNRILAIDPESRTAIVEPGVVLDHLNAALTPHGLQFAPDVATSSRATIGGMIANNSCGAHSVLYGRTVDHVFGLDVVLADGSLVHWSCDDHNSVSGNPLARRCDAILRETLSRHADDIAARYPKVLRSNAGYGLDRLNPVRPLSSSDELRRQGHLNTHALICGSEGTLGIVTRAVLNLVPLPKAKGLVVVQFARLLDALAAVPAALDHMPAAIELIDALILSAARQSPKLAAGSRAIKGTPEGVLIIELYDDDSHRLAERLNAIHHDMRAKQLGDAHTIVIRDEEQTAVWNMRKAGLGLLMSRPGDRQPYAFVEDTAVDPARLRDYIARFSQILTSENVDQAGYYAHASVGCLHVRPVLNLKNRDDVARMRRIAERVSSLAFEFGGTMTGEHGDGLLRSEWIEVLYGARLVDAFRTIKQTFDPQNILNPGKIVDPPRMTEHLRYGASFTPIRIAGNETALDFSSHGGMTGLAGMCSGVGQCRQKHVGTMCPSYEGTGDELHTTRARANALRIAMSNRPLLADLDDPALDEVMDLCISCKACKTECPTGVDMARLKAEWQHRRHLANGAPLRSRLIAHTATLARIGSRAPRLANAIAQSAAARQFADQLLGIDRRVAPPLLARQTFRDWFSSHRLATKPNAGARRVVYFVDTWTDLFTPDVGRATVHALEAFGCEVVVPPPVCCGRPAISKGMLDIAREQLDATVQVLSPLLTDEVTIVGTEPSCLFTLVDEMPQLIRKPAARRVAERAKMIETFLTELPEVTIERHAKVPSPARVRFHGHCHQKAMIGTADTLAVLRRFNLDVEEINSGCCGMAGSFGHEREHYDVSTAIGESRLFPAVRSDPDAQIAVSGFSCRHQIAHHTGATPRHFIEIIAESIAQTERFRQDARTGDA